MALILTQAHFSPPGAVMVMSALMVPSISPIRSPRSPRSGTSMVMGSPPPYTPGARGGALPPLASRVSPSYSLWWKSVGREEGGSYQEPTMTPPMDRQGMGRLMMPSFTRATDTVVPAGSSSSRVIWAARVMVWKLTISMGKGSTTIMSRVMGSGLPPGGEGMKRDEGKVGGG